MKYATLAAAVLLLLAGCAGPTPGPDPAPTETPEPTPTAPPTATLTPTPTATPPEPAPTETSEPEPLDVTTEFETCEAVTVYASNYTYVGLFAEDDVSEYRGEYGGPRTFTADSPIKDVTVVGPGGSETIQNPEYRSCISPPTPEPSPEPTPAPTPEPTPTATPTPTPTPEPTPTETPEPEPLRSSIDIIVKTEDPDRANDPERNVTEVQVRFYNGNEYPVEVDYRAVFAHNSAEAGDVQDTVAIDPEVGNGVTVEYRGDHAGNVTSYYFEIEDIRYDG